MVSPRISAARRMTALIHRREPGHPDLVEATLEHAELAIEDFVTRTLTGIPPLRAEQIARLCALLEAPMGAAV